MAAQGAIEWTLDGGGKITLRTDDVRASVSVATYNTASVIGPTRAVRQSKTAAEVMQLVFALGELADGAAVTLHLNMSVR